MKQIIIGKEGTQPFAINDPNVSRKHAYLNINEITKQMQLVDNNSTNGTFIYNGNTFIRLYANQPYDVNFDSMIQLGPNTRFHIKKLFQKPVAPSGGSDSPKAEKPKPKRADIKHLHQISNTYIKRKMELEAKANTINGLRTANLFITIGVGGGAKLITNNMSPEISVAITVALALVFWGILQIIITVMNKNVIKKRMDNEHEYAVRYCCPECHTSFRNKVYENILAEGKCPKCKTEYYDSSSKK